MHKRNRGSVPNKRVLIVSYRFPPDSAAGSVRVSQFVRWLPSYGWDPYVLTCIPSEYAPRGLESPVSSDHIIRTPSRNYVEDLKQALYRVIKGETLIPLHDERTVSVSTSMSNVSRICNPFSEIHWPDYALFWQKGAVKRGLTFLRDNPVDLIFSSSPPPSSHIVASRIARQTGIPWVAEYRDPWSRHYMKRMCLLRKLEEIYERKVMKTVNKIITVKQSWTDDIKSVLQRENDINILQNGFDFNLYCGKSSRRSTNFVMNYTGFLYSEYRLDPFFRSVRRLMDENIIDRDLMKINFYGNDFHGLGKDIQKYSLGGVVTFHGRLSHDDIVRVQIDSSLLILFAWWGTGNKGNFPAKTFEYLAAGRPIICSGPGGDEIERLLYETRGGVYCTSEDMMYETLKKWIEEWKATGMIDHRPRWDRIMTYSRETQTETLAGIFEKVMEEAAEGSRAASKREARGEYNGRTTRH